MEHLHRIALLVDHILNRPPELRPGPKVARAAMPGPPPAILAVQFTLIQGAAAVRFQRDQYAFRFAVPGDYNMNMIRANVRG